MTSYYIEYTDLEWQKQQYILNSEKDIVLEELQEEAEENRAKYPNRLLDFCGKEIFCKDATWQEIIVDLYSLDYDPNDWKTEKEKKAQLLYAVDNFAEEKAEEKINEAFKRFEIEI
jgi:hypothetical protein